MSTRYAVRFHPSVRQDLEQIVRLIADYSGTESAKRRLAEIEAAIRSLEDTPHKGSIRDHIAAGLRAIPAGRRAVIAFRVDDTTKQVLVYAVSYAGADWVARVRDRK